MKPISRAFSIRYKVMLLSLLPMTLLALVLASYFTLTRVAETRDKLQEQGASLARLMASAAEFGVLTGNRELLRSLSAGPVRDEEVADILFYDQDFRLIYRSGEFDIQVQRDQQSAVLKDGSWRFVAPIRVSALRVQDNSELIPITDNTETLGWVAVIISAHPTAQREREILLRSSLLTLICLVITLILANRFGRHITGPILALSRVIEQLKRGELDARAQTHHSGELHSLATGINSLAARVQESNQQFEFRVESATRRLKKTLEHLEERNHELLAERRRADEANHAKDEFLARMSHELRTPLTSVIGFTELLTRTRLDRDQQQYLRIIKRTSELLLTIIDDILDFSRLESNAIQLETISFDLEQTLFDVVDAQAPAAAAKGLELITDLAVDLPEQILGDPARLCQVLNNLLGNAIKFTENGQVALEVRVKRLPGNPALLQFRVRDTGIGISSDRIDRLFSAFTQGDSSISRRFGGSGLGLVIAHHLIERMGGRINLDSVEGEGTEVLVELPLQLPSRIAPPLCIEQPPLVLLLHEPHEANRRVLLRLLQPIAAQVHLLHHPEELSAYSRTPPAQAVLVAVDARDRDADNAQALYARIRAHTDLPLVMLLPAHLPLQVEGERLQLLSKPVRPSRLYHCLGFETEVEDGIQPVTEEKLLPHSPRILVAEDNDFNRLLILRLLEGLGARVSEATNGREVLQALEQQLPDLILMDVHMPEMDGIQTTRAVRQRFPRLPIVALTANVVPHEHQALLAAGIDDLLLKPINLLQLSRTLLQLCAHQEEETGARLEASLQGIAPPEALHQEVRRLSTRIMTAFRAQDWGQVRHHAHQLLGMAGLYEMPLLEDSAAQLHQAAQEMDPRALWRACSRLARLARKETLE